MLPCNNKNVLQSRGVVGSGDGLTLAAELEGVPAQPGRSAGTAGGLVEAAALEGRRKIGLKI